MNPMMRVFVIIVVLIYSFETFAFKLQRPTTPAILTRTSSLPNQSNLYAARKTYWPVKKVKEYQSPSSRFYTSLKLFASKINVTAFTSGVKSVSKGLLNLVVTVVKKVIQAMLSFISKLKDISIKDNKKPPSPFPPMSKLAPAPASPVIPANQIASTAKILTPSYQPVSSPSSALLSPSSASSTTTTSTKTSTSAGAGRKTSYWPPKSAARLINDADKQYAQRVLSELANTRVTPPPPSISTASSVKNSKYWPPKRPSMYRAASTTTFEAATVASSDSPVSIPVKEVVDNSDHDNEDKKEVDNHDYSPSTEVDVDNIKSSDAKYFPPIPVKYYYE